jgi:large subunit ribosomal protein L25
MGTPYGLSASPREKIGKGGARQARRDGHVPGVVYGGEETPVAVNLNYRDVQLRIVQGGFLTTVVTLDVGGKKIRTIPREYQLDPVRDRPLHVDFLRIAEGSTLRLEIPVRFINEAASPGIKRGGVHNIVRHTIELFVPADAIPGDVTVDLTGLEINDSVHIAAVTLPPNVRPTIQRNFTVATIAAPAGVKEEAAEAAAAAAAAATASATATDTPAADGAAGATGGDAKAKGDDKGKGGKG